MKCDNKCKYFDEEDGCLYPYLGDGNPKHAPCFRSTADVVEVIRCEDCAFWKNSVDAMVCDLTHGMKGARDYCSYAVRRKK